MKPTKKAAEMTAKELARYIDQSVLKPEFTQEEIKKYTQEGIDFGCATICINPASLELVSKMVEGTDTGICVVCDFPFGLSTTESKAKQAEEYCSKYKIMDLDIVANYGQLRSGNLDYVTADIKAVVDVCHSTAPKLRSSSRQIRSQSSRSSTVRSVPSRRARTTSSPPRAFTRAVSVSVPRPRSFRS